MAIYKMVKGQEIKISQREIKRFVMNVNNWSAKQYDRERYKIKNRIRALEKFESRHGKEEIEPQSPTEFLYFEAKAKKQYGKQYQPSLRMQLTRNFITTRGRKNKYKGVFRYELKFKRELEKQGISWHEHLYKQYVVETFGTMIDKVPEAKEIWEQLKDGNEAEAEHLLRELGKLMNFYEDEVGRKVPDDRTPFAQYGGGRYEAAIEAFKEIWGDVLEKHGIILKNT